MDLNRIDVDGNGLFIKGSSFSQGHSTIISLPLSILS